MKLISRYIPLFILLLCIPLARAQSSGDVSLGFGSAWDKSTGTGIDNALSSNPFNSCLLSTGDLFCQATPGLHRFVMGFGGDLMLDKHFGFGAELNFQPVKGNYAPLQYRQTFYDFNGIYAPINIKQVMVQLQGGIGGARTSFSFSQSSCVGTAVCTTQAQSVGNSNHFQAHAGVGIQFALPGHFFIRPQFDFHYVPSFTQQFGRNGVPDAMIWLGYSFGGK